MKDQQAIQAAREIADQMIAAARGSGDDPIAWVTGNQYMPPLRSFPAAEAIYQKVDHVLWEILVEELESLLGKASVSMECPEYDNSLYVVDLARFEYAENEEYAESEDAWYLQDDYKPRVP